MDRALARIADALSSGRRSSSKSGAAVDTIAAALEDAAIEKVRAERYNTLDRVVNAWQARATQSISPLALLLAYSDWAIHLAGSPGKQAALGEKALRKCARLLVWLYRSAGEGEPARAIEPLPQDHRFDDEAWRKSPFNLISQSFLLSQQWWHNATTGVRGVSAENERIVNFATRQLLDMAAPSNFVGTNPAVFRLAAAEGGRNFWRGAVNLLEDWERALGGKGPVGSEAFQVGRDVAATPGKIVYRNELIELIQYAPTTGKVRPEPILIVPAWIMKYYILDLSPGNSLVRYLVEQGFTVFAISWRNPGPEQRNLGMDDYRRLGIMAAHDAIRAIQPDTRVHACGYCLGGTLLAITAAAMARGGDDPFASLTFLAAQTDFTEAGELMLFTNESQVSYLEDAMWEQGYLDSRQMAGAFQLLRSNDLIWSKIVRQYLMGEREPMNDLMAWNADATRLPYRMHSEYLRHCFLKNDLAEGRWMVEGRPVALTDIRAPIFAVATRSDHVAPWRSVYKIRLLTDTEVTFVLTSGGHNAGIVSEPGHPGRTFQIAELAAGSRYVDPETWASTAPVTKGSWWPDWIDWLAERSSAEGPPPPMGADAAGYPVLGDAPGNYVLKP